MEPSLRLLGDFYLNVKNDPNGTIVKEGKLTIYLQSAAYVCANA